MKNKRILKACITLLCIISLSLVGVYSSYAATDFKSNGRLEYTNRTPDDPSDDVIFDTADLTVLDTAIHVLDTRITTLAGTVDSGIGRIVDELNRYPGIDLEQKEPDGTGDNPSLEEIAQTISGITNIPADTYFYEDGTEGDSNIIRYKKINGKYYLCDAHGNVNDGAKEVDVSQKTLIDYAGAVSANLSAGAAAFADGHLHLGDGSDNASHYSQGWIDGQKNAIQNLNITYTYHTHEGEAAAGTGCYTVPVYHSHINTCLGTTTNSCGCTTDRGWHEVPNNGSPYPACDHCGHFYHQSSPCGFGTTTSYYKCGLDQAIEGYSLGCGKTEQTIETATIKY